MMELTLPRKNFLLREIATKSVGKWIKVEKDKSRGVISPLSLPSLPPIAFLTSPDEGFSTPILSPTRFSSPSTSSHSLSSPYFNSYRFPPPPHWDNTSYSVFTPSSSTSNPSSSTHDSKLATRVLEGFFVGLSHE